jgi:hypothetical protein
MSPSPTLRLVAPWYRWRRQADRNGLAPRRTRPVLQKFADAGLVNRFLADPQHSYRFVDEDFVHVAEASPYAAPGSGLGVRSLAGVGRHRTGVRKLFRPTHRRHYLVVSQLHCDEPGFPDARLHDVCEMGFVVRRRRPVDPDAVREERRAVSERIGVVRAQLRWLREEDPTVPGGLRPDPLLGGSGHPPRGPAAGPGRSEWIRRYLDELKGLRARLDELEGLEGVPTVREGWIPDEEHDGVGRWEEVEEFPREVQEEIHPVHPMVPAAGGSPDPAQGARLLFGLVPAGGASGDGAGVPRFDADHLYEIRVFVRRHDERCPRRRGRRDCRGPLVWSAATDPFRIASHSDPDGQRNNVVTAEMPDLEELAAHSGPAGGIRMVTPDGSALSFDAEGTDVSDPSRGGGQICTFPIPLITIVARFVFSLFLPIVVFVFQLFFLLRLKLCIPPSLTIGAGLQARVDQLQGLGLSLDADVQVRALLVECLNDAYPRGPDGGGVGDALAAEYSSSELWELVEELAGAEGGGTEAPLTERLLPEERVMERPRVDAPELLGSAS